MILFPFFRLLCCFYFSTCIGLFKDKKEIGLSRINSLLPNSLTHSLSPSHSLTHARTHPHTHWSSCGLDQGHPSATQQQPFFRLLCLTDPDFLPKFFCCCCLRLVLPSFIHHPELNAFIFPRLRWTRKHSSTNDRKWWLGKKARETSQVAQDPQF